MTSTGLLLAIVLASGWAQSIVTYRAQHRPAQELVAAAETALGSDGIVTLDARTATLVLSGAPDAIDRALDLLATLDRAMANLVLTSTITETEELERLGLDVDWRVSGGGFSIGTVRLPGSGLRVVVDAGRERSSSTIRSTLRLLEGTSGLIVTGEALPFVYRPFWGARAVDFVPAETGFEATATRLGDGKIQLELRPFSGRVERSGALRTTEAATSIVVAPGETVVVGEVVSDVERSSTSVSGVERARGEARQVLLVSVEVDEP